MAKQLSEHETAALRIIETCSTPPYSPATGDYLAHAMNGQYGLDTSPAGAHRTAASLCRKNLAWRAGTSKLQWYKITQPGRDALLGNRTGQWIAKEEPGGTEAR